MNTSSFLTVLRKHSGLPLVFRSPAGTVAPGYHLTEVKRVGYETMDCGALSHRWDETQFEIWVPALNGLLPGRGHMPADKFLRIIDRVQAELPLNGDAEARIHASIDGQIAALHDIESVTAREGSLWVELTPDRTRCKAAERRTEALTGGCCGSNEAADGVEVKSDCGCGAPAEARAEQQACCA